MVFAALCPSTEEDDAADTPMDTDPSREDTAVAGANAEAEEAEAEGTGTLLLPDPPETGPEALWREAEAEEGFPGPDREWLLLLELLAPAAPRLEFSKKSSREAILRSFSPWRPVSPTPLCRSI